MTKLTFMGAARTVTGSKYLLEVASHKILSDCGLFQGLKELRVRNWADLCRLVLPDSARLQEEEAREANRLHYSRHSPALPLYRESDAFRALSRHDETGAIKVGFDQRGD